MLSPNVCVSFMYYVFFLFVFIRSFLTTQLLQAMHGEELHRKCQLIHEHEVAEKVFFVVYLSSFKWTKLAL